MTTSPPAIPLCLFCQQPARVDLGDRLRLIIANLEAIQNDASLERLGARAGAEIALLCVGHIKMESGYAERYRLYAKRPRIVAHPGCVADWAHDEAREPDEDGGSDGFGIAYEAGQDPDVDGFLEDRRQEAAGEGPAEDTAEVAAGDGEENPPW